MVHKRLFSALLLSILPAFLSGEISRDSASENAAEAEAFLPPALVSNIRLMVPRFINHLPIQDPKVEFRIRIASDGTLEDYVCLAASHPDLIEPATRALENAAFIPAVENGRTITADLGVTLKFGREAISQQSLDDHIDSISYQMQKDSFRFEQSTVAQLDAPPQIVERGTPYVPTDANEQRIEGEATIEGYIDRHGQVRMLRILRTTDPEVSKAAFLTFQNVRFAPPLRDGNPTVVKVRLPYVSRAE